MKKVFLTMIVAGTALFANAQNLPKPSPLGEVEQTVGVTEIELEYSRPSANGRTIFGGLVPYDALWRFGANASTKIETNGPLEFDSGVLEPGEYAIFAIPRENGVWDIIFNKDSKGAGVTGYTDEEDVLRVIAGSSENSYTETFTLGFDKITPNSASIVMLWENLKVDIPFKVNSEEMAKQNIKEAIEKGEDLDKVYNNAAGYYFNILGDYEKTLKYADKSIAIKESHANIFTKARALEKLGNKTEAIELANKALIMAEAAGSIGYAQFISGTLEVWSK
jgi:tetratricopeptide (TPR) repeat protein